MTKPTAKQRDAIFTEALKEIADSAPVGSVESDSYTASADWKRAFRNLQGVARLALRRADTGESR